VAIGGNASGQVLATGDQALKIEPTIFKTSIKKTSIKRPTLQFIPVGLAGRRDQPAPRSGPARAVTYIIDSAAQIWASTANGEFMFQLVSPSQAP
jgi:hypothetical protein